MNELKDFIVKIRYGIEGNKKAASGVIVKADDSCFYIITAFHTFRDCSLENEINLKELEILCKKENYIIVDDYMIFEEHDIVIFICLIKNESNLCLNTIKKLSILNVDFEKCKHIVIGYPNIGDGSIEHYKCSYYMDNDDDPYNYELSSDDKPSAIPISPLPPEKSPHLAVLK
jgi:hypothetical protein